jgi:micrococcal nuclease
VQVIDGDTVELLGGEHVRYLCIDTPERDEDYYHEASRRNKELVEGKMVELWPGLEDRDVYGRLLRFVFVDGTFVNAELVAEGLAMAYIFDPNERYSDLFIKLEGYAKLKGIGIWSERQPD